MTMIDVAPAADAASRRGRPAGRRRTPPGTMRSWAPVKIPKERIDAEIDRSAEGPTPPGGRRIPRRCTPS